MNPTVHIFKSGSRPRSHYLLTLGLNPSGYYYTFWVHTQNLLFTGWSKKNVTFVRFWVLDLGRGVFRGSFSPEIDWWWSQVPYKCPTCGKHMFLHLKHVILNPQNMCFPHGIHVWGMWDQYQSISEGKLSLIIPLPESKTQILTKVMFFGCKNTYFTCKSRWIMGKKHVFSTWWTHVGHLRS